MRGRINGDSTLLQGADGGAYDRSSPDALLNDCGGYWLQMWSSDGGVTSMGYSAQGDDEGDGPQ